MNVDKVFFVVLCFLFLACAETEQPKIDCSLVNIDVRVAEVDYADCGLANGKVFLRVNGGEEPYAYSLKGEAQAGALFSELRSDFYTFYVSDRNGCTDSVTTFVGSKEGVTATAKITASGCEDDRGMIELTARNGVEPYRYQLGENGDYTTSPIFENLPAGSYSLWVADGNDCSIGIYVDVPTGVSYSNSIADLVYSGCATDACHGGSHSPDLFSHESVADNAETIAEVIDSHATGILSEEEIRNFKCWIEDGAPNN